MAITPQLSLDFRRTVDLKPGDGVRVQGKICRVGKVPGTYETLTGEPFIPGAKVWSVVKAPAYDSTNR